MPKWSFVDWATTSMAWWGYFGWLMVVIAVVCLLAAWLEIDAALVWYLFHEFLDSLAGGG